MAMNRTGQIWIWVLAFTGWMVSAQGQEVLVSDKISIKDDYAFYLLGKLNDQYLLLRDKETDYIVHAFNNELEKTWTKKLHLDGRRTEIVDAFGRQDGYYVLYQFRRKANTFLKIHRYNASGELTDSLVVKDYGVRFNTPFPLVQYSLHKRKLLIYNVSRRQVATILFDLDSMRVSGEHEFHLDKALPDDYLFQPLVGDDGTIVLGYELYNYKSRQRNHRYVLHVLQGGKERKLTVPAGDFLAVDYHFVLDPLHHRIIGCGLYAEGNINRANGVFTFSLDYQTHQDKNLVSLRRIGFSKRLLASLSGKTGRKSLRGVKDMQIRDVIPRSDGGLLMLAEEIVVFHRSTIEVPGRYRRTSPGRMATDYYYQDVFALSVNPNGAPDWHAILYKNQNSQNDEGIYSSYFLWQNKSSVQLLYNDNIRPRTIVQAFRLHTSGRTKRQSLFNTGDRDLLLRLRDGLQIAPNEAIFPSQMRRRLRLVVIRYPEV